MSSQIISVSFPGGKRVDAQVGNHLIQTDQPKDLGGEDNAPAPYDLFLASVATCAGIYALGFCQSRGLSTEGLKLTMTSELDPATKLLSKAVLQCELPKDFPEKYRASILRAMEGCKVKKSIAAAPAFEVQLSE